MLTCPREQHQSQDLVFDCIYLCSVCLLQRVMDGGVIRYFVGGWSRPVGIGIELRIDTINALVLLAITAVALLTAVFSFRRVQEDKTEKTPLFYALYLLLVMGLSGKTRIQT